MGVIHKHPLVGPAHGSQVIHLFKGSTVQHFGLDLDGNLYLWVHESGNAQGQTERREFSVRRTGESFEGVPLLTTIVGGFVWHLVEHTEDRVNWGSDGDEVIVRPAGDGRDWEAVMARDNHPIRNTDGEPLRGAREDLRWRLG